MTPSLDRLVAVPATRRRFLKGSAALAIGGLVAACGGREESSRAATAPTGTMPQASATGRALDGEPVEVWRDPG